MRGLDDYTELNDNAWLHTWNWMQRIGFRATKTFVHDFLVSEALYDKYHPVVDYIGTLKWDGKPRLNKLFSHYGDAEDNDYTQCIISKTMIAMVRRVRNYTLGEGIKFDQIVVLEGPGGIGKSTMVKKLAKFPGWFTDDVSLTSASREIIEKTEGKVIVEVPELQRYKKSELDESETKAMLSREVDSARAAYGRFNADVTRQFVFFGTVNTEKMDGAPCAYYLKDHTGNRRYWPVRFNGKIKLTELERDMDQIWGEAAHREAAGEPIEMPETLWEFAAQEQEARMAGDPWEELLDNALADVMAKGMAEAKKKAEAEAKTEEEDKNDGSDTEKNRCVGMKILIDQVWTILGKKPGDVTEQLKQRLGRVMKKLGWDHGRQRLAGSGKPKWFYRYGKEPHDWTVSVINDKGTITTQLTQDLCECGSGGGQVTDEGRCPKCRKRREPF